jgi:MFS transporter, putative metabolite:H+ symporter
VSLHDLQAVRRSKIAAPDARVSERLSCEEYLARDAQTIVARLDRLPATAHILKLVLLLSMGEWFESYDLFVTGYIAPGMIASGVFATASTSMLATNSIAVFVAATFLGLLIGTLVFGSIMDQYGRRIIFMLALVVYTFATVVMAFMNDAWSINVCRVIDGIGLG